MPVVATLSAASCVARQRHAVLAIGSGLTGLTATKALKFGQVNITDALVFVTRIAVQTISRWGSLIPSVGMASVFVVLAVAAVANIVKIIAAQPDSLYLTTLYSGRNR